MPKSHHPRTRATARGGVPRLVLTLLAACATMSACGGNPGPPPAAPANLFGVGSHATPVGAVVGMLDAMATDGDDPTRAGLLTWVDDVNGATGQLLDVLPVHYTMRPESFSVVDTGDTSHPDGIVGVAYRISVCDTATGRCTLLQPDHSNPGNTDNSKDSGIFETDLVGGRWLVNLATGDGQLGTAFGSLQTAEGK